jgi:hypothetical protein
MSEQNVDDGLEDCLTIQPTGPNGPAGVMPYPWHVIVSDGAIGRQDFWRGNPLGLLGFANKPRGGAVNLAFSVWTANPDRAIGKYPVFMDGVGNFSTGPLPIESVQPGRTRRHPRT